MGLLDLDVVPHQPGRGRTCPRSVPRPTSCSFAADTFTRSLSEHLGLQIQQASLAGSRLNAVTSWYDRAVSSSVTVIVCAYAMGRLKLTMKSVTSIFAGSLVPTEVLLVVDNNDDLQETLIRELGDLPVRIIPNHGNGAADARTTAIMEAKNEIVAFIDDDAWADATWLQELATAFEDARVVGAGGLVLPDWAPQSTPLPAELLWIVGSTYKGHALERVAITRPIGANMAARRSALLAVGGFPSAFGPREGRKSSSNEELAVFTQLRTLFGADSILYVPTAVVHHYAPAERTTWRYLFSRSWAEGTSKADARALFGRQVMRYDGSYVTGTLLPGAFAYLRNAYTRRSLSEFRNSVLCLTSLCVAATSYSFKVFTSSSPRNQKGVRQSQ
jgi:glucosyl-dolichyl phosphate glucuronosyltransferase